VSQSLPAARPLRSSSTPPVKNKQHYHCALCKRSKSDMVFGANNVEWLSRRLARGLAYGIAPPRTARVLGRWYLAPIMLNGFRGASPGGLRTGSRLLALQGFLAEEGFARASAKPSGRVCFLVRIEPSTAHLSSELSV
jgi:hypothetical protein